MSEQPRQKPYDWADLERQAGIKRNREPAPTPNDLAYRRKKILSSWGKPRREFRGPK